MNVAFYAPFRVCDLCLTFEDGAVFADFVVEPATGRLYLARISFDGYGCCQAPPDIGRMGEADSEVLRGMAATGVADRDVLAPILRAYFAANAGKLWDDALREYDLR